MNYPKITLTAARVNANYTQEEAALKLGIDKKTLSNYENGKTVPNWEMVSKIEKLYQFPSDLIFFGSALRLKREERIYN